MQVNLEKNDALIVGFGGTTLLAIIILGAIFVGHAITVTSSVPAAIHVDAATPHVTIAVPQQAAPKVEVACPPAHIDVHVPAASPQTINVQAAPATVTVVEREKAPQTETKPAQAPSAPPKVEAKTIPASLETRSSSEVKEEITIDALYAYAEKYVESYCRKSGLDPASEKKKWTDKWNVRVDTAVKDGGSEQSLMDRTIVDCRACFDLSAPSDRVVEGCRLMLRIRDAKLSMLDAMRSAMTQENLLKTVAFLQAGAK